MDNLLLNSYYIKFHSKQVEDWFTNVEIVYEKYIDKVALHDSIVKIINNKIYEIGFKSILIDFHNTFDYIDEVNEKKNLEEYIQASNLQENKIISSKIDSVIENTLNYITEIINHYMEDYNQIKNMFNIKNDKITSILLNEGDTHNNGKSVARINLNEEIIIYKPKDLGPDIFYYKMIELYNEKSKRNLYIPKCLNKKNYGWQEFVNNTKSTSIEDVTNYYNELGIHSCFLYLLQASDIHFENIISMNRHPVLIDLETIFQSELNLSNASEDVTNYSFITNTILGTLLFDIATSPLEDMVLFIGGTTNPNRQTYNKELLVDINSDKMRLINSIHRNTDVSNVPLLNNDYQEIYNFIEDYSDGFVDCYTFILNNKDFLETFIMDTENFSIRYVLRPTYIYAKFIDALKDPNRLMGKNQNDLHEILDKASASLIQKDTILELEFSDIQEYDVPLFNSDLDSKALFHSKSGVKIDRFLLKEPRNKVLDKLHTFSEKDCNYQLELINMAISSYYENADNDSRRSHNISKTHLKKYISNKEILSSKLSTVKDKLKVNHDFIQALSLRHDQRGNSVLSTMPMGIYDGLAGLGLLLAAEQKVLGTKNEKEIQKLNNTINMLYDSDLGDNLFSIYHGKASYFKYYLELNRINNFFTINLKTKLIDFCKEILQSNISRAPLDYIGGIAGLLSLLIDFKEEVNDKILDECILFLKSNIFSRLKAEDDLLYWSSDFNDSISLACFSHGITGINYSLSKIIHIYPDLKDEIIDIICKTSLYEDTIFNKDINCWMDNREIGQKSTNTWCNGNSGILLGRSLIEQNTGVSLNYINETESLILKENFLYEIDHSICHGLAGNLVILNKLNNYNDALQLEEIRNTLYSALSTDSIQSGYKYNTNTLSFFLSNVGVIYSLLHDIDHTLPHILI
ncbi:type 2 lanthipeptide synthetase LanM [Lysinibacillus sp. NPDC059133]|uniref:type 2 lanthipeptide synthetase LanM n=1 Tax=Lysinibacillus sp. NPDC059133 TaxID=3346737 RepID=UPI00368B75DE